MSPADLSAIAEEIVGHFEVLGRLAQDNQQPFTREEKLAREREIAREQAELDQKLEGMSPEEQQRYLHEIETHEGQERLDRARDRMAANRGIRELLGQIREEDYPRSDPETPEIMLGLLGQIAMAYASRPGRPRPLDLVLRYLRSSIPNVWWLWSEWINAAICCEEYAVAETMLQCAWHDREFVTMAKGLHGKLVAARGVIYLVRDWDFAKALDWMETARDRHGYEPSCIALYRQLAWAERKGIEEDLVIEAIDPTALITGAWNDRQFKRGLLEAQEAEDAEEHKLLEHAGGEEEDGDHGEEQDQRGRRVRRAGRLRG